MRKELSLSMWSHTTPTKLCTDLPYTDNRSHVCGFSLTYLKYFLSCIAEQTFLGHVVKDSAFSKDEILAVMSTFKSENASSNMALPHQSSLTPWVTLMLFRFKLITYVIKFLKRPQKAVSLFFLTCNSHIILVNQGQTTDYMYQFYNDYYSKTAVVGGQQGASLYNGYIQIITAKAWFF